MTYKLNNFGISHYLLPIVLVVLVAIGGVYSLVASHADPFPPRSVRFTSGMSIDNDGVGSAHNDPYHQSTTSYASGVLNADKTNYIALAPGWAHENGVQLGDVAVVKYKGRSAYAVYGDKYVGNSAHGEGSVRLARALGIPSSSVSGGVSSGVTYIIFPDSHVTLKNGTTSQSKINAVGRLYAR